VTLSVVWTVKHEILERLVLNKFERTSKRVRHMDGRSEENHENISQDKKSSG
jgi:hypothetical protein